jgi:hypothetical protein
MTRDFAERSETPLAEVRHKGEVKHQLSEPLAHGKVLHATIY